MIAALVRAFAELSAPPLRRIVGISLALAVLTFILLWLGVAVAIDHIVRFGWRPLDWLVDLLGGAGVLALSWLLFPAIVTLIMGFFLDRVAAEVEALDYPDKAALHRPSATESVMVTLRLMVTTIIMNLLALPVYVLVPGLNFFVFLGLNGYLFGRQYFEVVALRRLDTISATALRRRFGARIFVGGVVIAGLFALPLVNLLAPVIATAFMVHLFQRLARLDPRAFTPLTPSTTGSSL